MYYLNLMMYTCTEHKTNYVSTQQYTAFVLDDFNVRYLFKIIARVVKPKITGKLYVTSY